MRLVFTILLTSLCLSATIAQEFNEQILDQQGYPLDDPRYADIRKWFEAEQLGLSLYRSEEYEQAYLQLATAAQHGFKQAQHNIAIMHINGEGVEKIL